MDKRSERQTYHRYCRTGQRITVWYHCDPLGCQPLVVNGLIATTTYPQCASELRAKRLSIRKHRRQEKTVTHTFTHMYIIK